MRILIILFFLANNIYAYCCTCLGPETMEEDFKQSAYIFEGTVISKEIVWVKDTLYPILVEKGYLKAGSADRDSVQLVRTTIQIEKRFKGRIKNDQIIIYAGFGDIDCGFTFTVGQKYIVFTSQNKYVERDEPERTKNSLKVNTSQCGFTSSYAKEKSKIIKGLSRNKKES
jgi:hypothetical protein